MSSKYRLANYKLEGSERGTRRADYTRSKNDTHGGVDSRKSEGQRGGGVVEIPVGGPICPQKGTQFVRAQRNGKSWVGKIKGVFSVKSEAPIVKAPGCMRDGRTEKPKIQKKRGEED